ncbi:MAG: adenylylsulfate kinase [Acidimicrobiaceae bacterium]|nr:adenylylsulfate kinase [Acidimicrobiaceae bacterium]
MTDRPVDDQLGATVWLTGLPAAGKSTLARAVEVGLRSQGVAVCRLDADELRDGLNSDLGFTPEDRRENIRRVGEVALLVSRMGFVALVAIVSPYRDARALVRGRHRDACVPFIECHVATPVQECARRDPKGLYRRAHSGELEQFTGVSAPYEEPLRPNLVIDPGWGPETAARAILAVLAGVHAAPVR